MGANILHDIPQLLVDQRFVRILDDDLLVLRDVHPGLILVGERRAFQRVGVPEIDHVIKDILLTESAVENCVFIDLACTESSGGM